MCSHGLFLTGGCRVPISCAPQAQLYLLAVGLASSSPRNSAWLERYAFEEAKDRRMSRSVALEPGDAYEPSGHLLRLPRSISEALCPCLGEKTKQEPIAAYQKLLWCASEGYD